jgi:hypothetical protein
LDVLDRPAPDEPVLDEPVLDGLVLDGLVLDGLPADSVSEAGYGGMADVASPAGSGS